MSEANPGAELPGLLEQEPTRSIDDLLQVLSTFRGPADGAEAEAAPAGSEAAFMRAVRLLAELAELHDEATGNHIARVNEYSYFLAKESGMPDAFADELRYSAQLHDVGKISISAALLRKNGDLTDAERLQMDLHPLYGFQILQASPRLRMAAEIALHHHEKWDGSGYPQGMSGERIPISARFVALADIYDALRSERPYKPALSHKDAMAIMLWGDERIDPPGHFDPTLLALLRRRHEGMDDIYRRFRD